MSEPGSLPQKVLAFDIGIRNLAWCFLEQGLAAQGLAAQGLAAQGLAAQGLAAEGLAAEGAAPSPPTFRIAGWQNYDLLTGRGAEDAAAAAAAKRICSHTPCKAAASFQNRATAPTCLRHCPPSHPPLKDCSGATVLKKIPALPVLRSLAAAAGLPPARATKVQLLEFLASRVSLPLEKPKLKKAVEHDLALLHDAIRSFVIAHAELFRQATHILLENQPVLKNPTMKTVQILLFATLRDVLQPAPPPLKLVHAGKKVKAEAAAAAAPTGDAGYKARKDASEAKVIQILERGSPQVDEAATRWLPHFKGHGKKSDLADAFCMCWDWLAATAAPGAATAAPGDAPGAKRSAKPSAKPGAKRSAKARG